MKILATLIVLLLFSSFQCTLRAQFYPFSSIIRFGNTIYYPIDSLLSLNQKDQHLSYGRKKEHRYFDTIIRKDSISITICDSLVYFNQKSIFEPNCYEKFLFYKRRFLHNSNLSIKYMKILSISEKKLIAEATFSRNKNTRYDRKEKIVIDIGDIKGMFLGPGKEYRDFLTCMGIVAAFGGVILLF